MPANCDFDTLDLDAVWRAAARIAMLSSSFGAIGFSHHTCLPASSAAMAISG